MGGYLVEDIVLQPEIRVVNVTKSSACVSLSMDAAAASLVGIDAEWRPDWSEDSDNPISVLQLAFPRSGGALRRLSSSRILGWHLAGASTDVAVNLFFNEV